MAYFSYRFRVSKHKVGYRLREVLSGKSKTVREGKEHFKAYEFNREKMRRIAKKYGYELVTKLPLSPISEGVQAFNSPKNDVAEHEMPKTPTCFLCHGILPEDLAYCTYLDEKPVHCSCASKIEAQEKET